MQEIIANLHIHTHYSDGHASHTEIAQAAARAGIQVIITTDHNVLVQGADQYVQVGKQRILVLAGEEIHNQDRQPQKSHLLAIGITQDVAQYAQSPQILIDHIQLQGGMSFLAHPFDHALPAFGETDITWDDWDVHGFTGIELWNHLSEFKSHVHNLLQGVFYAYFSAAYSTGPEPETLHKWDELTTTGKQIVAVGGADAHALPMRKGPLRAILFPYEFHFKCINNHLLLPQPFSGDISLDRKMVYDAFRQGHLFVGYDLPAPTAGFQFTAQGADQIALMGDEIQLRSGVTLQARLPYSAQVTLLCNGQVIRQWQNQSACMHIVNQPGVYRVECRLSYLGKSRGWIFSNPIYVR